MIWKDESKSKKKIETLCHQLARQVRVRLEIRIGIEK